MTTSNALETFPAPVTLVYKYVNEHPIHIDIYPPVHSPASVKALVKSPAVMYFHGGALTVGNRKSWFPAWLHRRVVSSGITFISADYQLIPPASGHDILSDIKDLFRFLEFDVNQHIREQYEERGCRPELFFEVDAGALAVAGSSAGGMCAYLAAMHARPRPRAVLSLYGMGGDVLTWQYLAPKTTPFFRGREMLDPNDFTQFLCPGYHDLPLTSDSPLAYHSETYRIPGYPANPRMLLGRLYLQLGTFLDYFTSSHEPSLSATLRELFSLDGRLAQHADPPSVHDIDIEAIPAEHRRLFPQLNVTSSLPPMFLIHGSADTAVLVRESKNLYTLLQDAGVRVEIHVVEGKEHSFDYDPTAEEEFGGSQALFDQATTFLKEQLLRYVAFSRGRRNPVTLGNMTRLKE